jgi:hypothetical protein
MVRALGLLGILVAGTRLFFLPPTLDDIDSVNFALALERFDPTLHQPQPPGYPVHVAATRLVHLFWADAAGALALVSALAQVALVPVLYAFFRFFSATPLSAFLSTALTMANPVLWLSGVRPMSDSFGLLVTISALTLLLSAPPSRGGLYLGSLLAGIAPGARLQSVFLTGPLFVRSFLRSPGDRVRALLALGAGSLLWLVPVAVASGGIGPYLRSLRQTMAEAAAWEPLVRDPNLNRIARSVVLAFWSPWGNLVLGSAVLGLAFVGLFRCLRNRPAQLGLAMLVFAPYVALHLLVQNVSAVRYSLLYLPLVCWLAVEGLAALALVAPRRRELVLVGATSALALAGSAIALPALGVYGASPSPIYAALEEAERIAQPRDRFLLTGHYMFSRYYSDRDDDLELLAPEPRRELALLQEYWTAGGGRTVLFLSDPARTDLQSFSPEASASRGYWRRPEGLRALLSGERPDQVELVEVSPPRWFTGPGWLISLESTPLRDLASFPERVAHLKPLTEPSFLLISGEPVGAVAAEALEVALDGATLWESDTERPLLAGFHLAPSDAQGWRNLVVRTGTTPFALRGLEYAPETSAGIVYGEGWFYPERDEELRPFRWAGPSARALVHVPEDGVTMVVEGVAPSEYYEMDATIALVVDGEAKLVQRIRTREFRIETHLRPGSTPFREVRLATSQSFVPDLRQKNGDRRELSLRIYRVHFSTGDPVTVAQSAPEYRTRTGGPVP